MANTTSTFSDLIGRAIYGTIQRLNADVVINDAYKNRIDVASVIVISIASFLSIVLIYSLVRFKKSLLNNRICYIVSIFLRNPTLFLFDH